MSHCCFSHCSTLSFYSSSCFPSHVCIENATDGAVAPGVAAFGPTVITLAQCCNYRAARVIPEARHMSLLHACSEVRSVEGDL